MRSRILRISAAEGGSEAISSSASTPEPTRQERTSSHAAWNGAEDDLGRAAADVDDADPAVDRMAERFRRADEGEPTLLLLAEDVDRDSGRLADRPRDLLPFGASRIAAVATARIVSAPSSRARRTWVATTSATSRAFSGGIVPLRRAPC